MAVFIPVTTIVTGTSNDALVIATNNAKFFVQEGVILSATGSFSSAIETNSSNLAAQIDGVLISNDDSAIRINNISEITFGASSSLIANNSAQSNAILAEGDGQTIENSGEMASVMMGINIAGANNSFTNSGSLTSEIAVGVFMSAGTNTGSISAHLNTIDLGSSDGTKEGIGGNTVVNEGTINSSTGAAISLKVTENTVTNSGDISASVGDGIVLDGGGTVSNTGLITSFEKAVSITDGGGNVAIVDNSGTIVSTDSDGLSVLGNRSSIVNSGNISGGDDAIFVAGNDVTVSNSGSLTALDDGIFVAGSAAIQKL